MRVIFYVYYVTCPCHVECDRYAAALGEYNRQMDLHNSAVMDFNEGDTEVAIPVSP